MAPSRFIATLAALALTAAACAETASSVSSTSTTSLSRPATTSPGGGSSNSLTQSDSIRAQVDALMIEAQQLRGLEFQEPVDVVLLNSQEYQERIIELFDEDLTPEDVEAANATYRLLGIIGPGEDVREMVETIFTAGTVGFYVPETGELVVRVLDDELGPYSQSSVVHELVHALQDQNFDLSDARQDLEGDAAYVASAILEGDARLRDTAFTESLSVAEYAGYVSEISGLLEELDFEAFQALPSYIRVSFTAAYDDGFEFHQRIGLDAIDEQFTDPPESSEQLLEPDKYRRDEQPIEVVLPDVELPGYEVSFDSTAGQKDIELLLTDAIGEGAAAEAASGWGGDANRIYNKGDEGAVYVLSYLGDTIRDAEELQAAYDEFIEVSVISDAYTLVERDGPALLVIIATDSALGPQLESAFS